MSSFDDPGFLSRFKKKLDARARAELSARVASYRREGLLPPAKAMTAKSEFDHFVQQLMTEQSMSRQQAVGEVFKRFPGLRQSMIREANKSR